jgi:hypothetical protein
MPTLPTRTASIALESIRFQRQLRRFGMLAKDANQKRLEHVALQAQYTRGASDERLRLQA